MCEMEGAVRNLLFAAAGMAALLGAATFATPSAAGAEDGGYEPTRIDRYDASGMPLDSVPLSPAPSQRLATRQRAPASEFDAGRADGGGRLDALRSQDAGAPVDVAWSRPPGWRPPHRPPHYRPPHYRPPHYRPPYYRPPIAVYPPYYAPPIYAPGPVYRPPRCVTRVVRRTPRGRVVRVIRGCGGRPYWRGY